MADLSERAFLVNSGTRCHDPETVVIRDHLAVAIPRPVATLSKRLWASGARLSGWRALMFAPSSRDELHSPIASPLAKWTRPRHPAMSSFINVGGRPGPRRGQ